MTINEHPDHPDRSTFYSLDSEWTHPMSGAVYKVIRREDGLLDWKVIRMSDGSPAPNA